LQGTSVRSVVARGGERESGIERQLEYALHQAFAKTRFTDDQTTPVILYRTRDDLRR
jgi:hypothetical protein